MEKRNDIQKILISEEQLAAKVAELGAAISRDYEGKKLMILGVLKGSVVFMADLLRHITIPVEMDFMAVSSYGAGVKTTGVVKILKDLDRLIEGYHVLVVEDILDSALPASASPPCWISRSGARWTSPRIMWASPFRTNSWWATAWITPSYTAIFPM